MRHIFQIEGWRIDASARTAERHGQLENLSPRAIRLLIVLSEANGATVSRSDLLDRVWPNVFVSDESLTQVVSELRRKLGNRALIATIARGGYRLTVPVTRVADEPSPASRVATGGLTLDAYTLCIEAMECFARASEGAHRSFVDLTAQAVVAAPDFAEARALHALALYKRHVHWSEGQDLFEAAMQEVVAALSLDPNNALAHLLDAAGKFTFRQAESAIRALETALALAPRDGFVHFNAGVILLSAGNRRAANALVTRARHLEPHRLGADLLSSRITMNSDPVQSRISAERALSMVKRELEINPCSMRALYALGPLLAQLGDHHGARSALEGVAHHNSPVEYFRALGFAQIGDVSSALERLDFLAMHGWRYARMLEQDEGFRPIFEDHRFQKFRGDLMAA